MMLPFTFSGVEKYLIAHQGPVVLLFYVLVLGGINYFQAKEEEKDSGGTLAQKYIDHIPVRQGRRVIPIAIGKILWIQAESPYSCLYTYEGKYLIHTSLKQLQTALDPEVMVRIHRSTIVNVNRIQELRSRSNGDYDVLLQNGKLLRWSRNYPGHLKELLRLTQ
jgi:DNA-binding LytR/AlgR family response regulator